MANLMFTCNSKPWSQSEELLKNHIHVCKHRGYCDRCNKTAQVASKLLRAAIKRRTAGSVYWKYYIQNQHDTEPVNYVQVASEVADESALQESGQTNDTFKIYIKPLSTLYHCFSPSSWSSNWVLLCYPCTHTTLTAQKSNNTTALLLLSMGGYFRRGRGSAGCQTSWFPDYSLESEKKNHKDTRVQVHGCLLFVFTNKLCPSHIPPLNLLIYLPRRWSSPG